MQYGISSQNNIFHIMKWDAFNILLFAALPKKNFLASPFLGKFPVNFGWRSFSLCSAQFPGKLNFFKTHTSDSMGQYPSSYDIFPIKQKKYEYSNFWQPVFRFLTSCSSYFASLPLPLTTPSPPPGPLAIYGADLVSYLFWIIPAFFLSIFIFFFSRWVFFLASFSFWTIYDNI